jgi:D-3-phosphoglycerate dehydrogenase
MSSEDAKTRWCMTALADSTVLVTPRSFGRGDTAMRARLSDAVGRVDWRQDGGLDAATLRGLVAEADGWIAGVEAIDRTVLEAATRLKVVARYGVGVDNVDLDAAAERGIVVTNTPEANAGAVAELVIGLLFTLARRITYGDREVRAGRWPRLPGIALDGKVLGLLGFGAIGRQVARRATALGCVVRAYDPVPDHMAATELGVELLGQDDVIATSDFVSLHAPVLPDTRGMVDAAFLARMKPGAMLVNAARAELVDERALADALRTGHLAGAALDVLAQAPPTADFALAELDNVVLTPHTGAHTDLAAETMARGALENCLAVLRGEPAPNPVVPRTRRRQ